MMVNELEVFQGLPARFGCIGETNPNRAFEKLTSRLVQESLALDGYEVIPQKTKKTWFGDNGDVRGIRQDILVKSGNNVIAVLDSKCKEQLSSSDLAEISLYIHENRLKSGIAIMPTCPGKPEIKWTSSDGKISIYEKRLDIAQIVNNLRIGNTKSITETICGWVNL